MTSVYGRPIRKYQGKAIARFSNKTYAPCQAHIGQVENGGILVRCVFSPKNAPTLPSFLGGLQIESLTGHIDSGLKFETRGGLFTRWESIKVATGYRIITLVGQEVVLGSEIEAKSVSLCKFSLVNFEFVGNEPAERRLKKGGQTVEEGYLSLKLNLPWGEVDIHPVPTYGQVLGRVKAEKGIAVTGEAVVSVLAESSFPEIVKKVNELCRLLSLARGTKINWVNAESIDLKGIPTHVILKHSVTWPFSSLALIDHRNSHDTPLFIEKVYPAYLKHRDAYNLDIAIEQYLDAKRETAYLETRGLAAVALIDSLQQLYASDHGLTEIVKGFDKRKSAVQEHLKKVITSVFPDIQNAELNEMLQKIPELNRRSFLSLLKEWASNLGLQIPASELAAIRDTRNSLAHRMRFKSTSNRGRIREYYRLINLVNQIFLKLLKYQGYYIHVDLETLVFERKELE